MRILDFLRSHPAGRICRLYFVFELDFFLVTPQVFGVIIMGVPLIEIPEPVVETLLVWYTRAAGLAEAPFADDSGSVAGPFH